MFSALQRSVAFLRVLYPKLQALNPKQCAFFPIYTVSSCDFGLRCIFRLKLIQGKNHELFLVADVVFLPAGLDVRSSYLNTISSSKTRSNRNEIEIKPMVPENRKQVVQQSIKFGWVKIMLDCCDLMDLDCWPVLRPIRFL